MTTPVPLHAGTGVVIMRLSRCKRPV